MKWKSWINRAREQVETLDALDTFVRFVIWQLSLLGLFEGFLAKIEEVCYLKALFWGMMHERAQNIYIYIYLWSQKHFVHQHF